VSAAALSNNVARSKQAAVYPGPAEAHATAVAGIKSTTADAIENISQLNAQLAELRQQQEDLREKYKQLQVHSDKIEQRVADLEPRTRHELSLYAHISKIVWKFNQSDRIAGMVSDKAHGDIRSFDYDITQLPPAEVVNKLWDIIAGLEENVQTL
jgi:kinetochore protein Spc24, animal type